MFPILQVIKICLMSIRLLFKANMQIGLHPVSVLNQKDKPLCYIPYKERNVKKFLLLCRMYPFMIEFSRIQRPYGKYKAEQTNSQVVSTHRMPLD